MCLQAYRKLALRLHPDKCKEDGAEEVATPSRAVVHSGKLHQNNARMALQAFKKVGEAFSVLSDADKRSAPQTVGSWKWHETQWLCSALPRQRYDQFGADALKGRAWNEIVDIL